MAVTPEVLIIGAGPSGLSAALRLARAGVRVLVLEGAEYAGAENWSGCVYHADGLLREDVLGRALWDEAPKERKIVARCLFVHDGMHAAGFEARAHGDNDYGEAWTVLRPKLDRWLASRAIDTGVTLLTGTTVSGLRYDDYARVVGVYTNRGVIDAPLVFIAEGDAAGLLAREGLEKTAHLHYAQGVKAVFQLAPAEIERRFGVQPGEGVAQEWILRNGQLAGRGVPLNITAFLYTNHASLSLGFAIPLAQLAKAGVADHPHLLQRVLQTPGIAGLLDGARQVAYGAKVIRSGGISQTPRWVADGLAVGGGSLGLGQEIPYPNFIGPAITSALTFADAVLRLRERGADYTSAELESQYVQALKATDDYASAQLIRRWPHAIHGGGMLFEHLPALLGQMVDAEKLPPKQAAAQQRRALAMQLGQLRQDLGQSLGMAWGLWPRLKAPSVRPAPLAVTFLVSRNGAKPVAVDAEGNALLRLMARAIGHFYGRRLPRFGDRINMVWRDLGALPLALLRVGGLGVSAGAGGLALVGDLAAYKIRSIPLREFMQRPYHRHDEATRQRLDWAKARRTPATPTDWIAPLTRYQPDARHLSIPLTVGSDAAQQLRNVCPAEVYSIASKLGGVASQFENCIKCESCRVSVPGIDWNRTSRHRLAYRVPGDGRYGYDASVKTSIALTPPPLLPLPPHSVKSWADLYRSLRARPAMVGDEWVQAWRRALEAIPLDDDVVPGLHGRLSHWLEKNAYGWMEAELRALLEQAQGLPPDTTGLRDPEVHARNLREHHWQWLRDVFTPDRLKQLSLEGWDDASRALLRRWIDEARAQSVAAVEWLAAWSPALAWVAANHFLAESYSARPQTDGLAAPVWREQDGQSNWLPAAAERLYSAQGNGVRMGAALAHGAGGDAAQPVRISVEAGLSGFTATPVMARLSLALALGQALVLRARAAEYAGQRVQFRGELKDAEGRDSIAKFGGVKNMLAGIEQAVALLQLARDWCEPEPDKVLALVREHMGPWMDAVPWLAGQIFGGMGYSEEDIFAPRYRDAMLFSQWPGAGELETEDPDFPCRVAQQAQEQGLREYVYARNLWRASDNRRKLRALMPPQVEPAPAKKRRHTKSLTWNAQEKFTYHSGSFINGQLLAPEQVLTIEHYARDAILRRTRADVLRLLRGGFTVPPGHLSYGRYIDALHAMPEADIQRLRDFNAFATIVPQALGGKGWSKAQYSVLTNLGMGRMDTAFGLLIMASTSIGTMPVMLGRDKDLPGLRAELTACLADQVAWRGLRGGIKRILRMLEHPEPKPFRQAMEQWGQRIQRMFLFPGSTLKYVARTYLLRVQQTVETAKRRDMQALGVQLRACQSGLDDLHRLLVEELDSLERREQAHARFLSFLACGQICAFALTEPSAGSDTGGIQTRAVLREVAADYDGVGFYTFTPFGKSEARVMLDAERLLFNDRSITYLLEDGREGLLDDSGWDLSRNSGRRGIRTADQVYEFDDIGTPLQRHGKSVYQYWEVSGNKMWITNGSVADRYSLYSQSPEGDIGFMLERRSEGLRIGPNENKLGQRASPTNELTLDRVRISADQVIGFRGHGQVNALETLSVGRGGLVMSCATLGERLLQDYAHIWRHNPTLHEAAQAELDRIQCLAARLVGLMDRVDLRRGDFRIEAALSKYVASEGVHRILGWLETLLGPQSAAREVIIEKWRRDIRILNIYEGTNEVQRFLVLKDLPNLLRESATPVSDNPALQSALQALREFAVPRVAALGAGLWQNSDLQTRWFPVVDWVADLYSWCALHERARLLLKNADPADADALRRLRALENSLAEHVQRRARWVRAGFSAGEEGRCYPTDASLVLARAALAPAAETDSGPVAVGSLSGDVALVLRSRAVLRGDNDLVWAGWHDADRAVLDRLLAWARHNPQLKIKLAAVAPSGVEDRLRQLLATGVELLHVVQPAGAMDTAAVADAVLRRWPGVTRWAFGRRGANAHDQTFVAQMAQWLALEVAQDITAVGQDEHGPWIESAGYQRHRVARERRLSWVWDIKPSGHSEEYSALSWLAALQAELPVVTPASATRVIAPRAAVALAASDLPESFASPKALAQWLKQRFGDSARPEPPARWQEANAALTGSVLWLAAADTLATVRGQAAPRVLRDLHAPDVALLVWHDAALPLPPISSGVQQPGLLRGVWALPLDGVVDANVLAHALKPHIRLPRRIVVAESQRDVGAALAACLGIALFDRVLNLEGDTVTCAYDGYVADHALPESALLIAGAEYKGSPLAEAQAAALPLTRLPPSTLRDNALTRWQAQSTQAGPGLATARLVLDIGLGIGDDARYHQWVPPLASALRGLSGRDVALGATRKITQELKLLPMQQQIGQTGIGVAPELLFALGISGAPQHMSWIDPKAVVIAINRDATAPIFTWHKQNAGPRVIACVGDLQVWLPELTRLLSS